MKNDDHTSGKERGISKPLAAGGVQVFHEAGCGGGLNGQSDRLTHSPSHGQTLDDILEWASAHGCSTDAEMSNDKTLAMSPEQLKTIFGEEDSPNCAASLEDATEPDDPLKWVESLQDFSGSTASVDKTLAIESEALETIFSQAAALAETTSAEAEAALDDPLKWAEAQGSFSESAGPADRTLAISPKALDTLFGIKSLPKAAGAKTKDEYQKEILPFENHPTPAELFFVNNKPYVRDERYNGLYQSLDDNRDLVAWMRRRLTKTAQFEVESSRLKAYAQILSEHPDYRIEEGPFCKKDDVILMQNGVVDLSGDIPVLREPYEDEVFDSVVQADFIDNEVCPSLNGTAFERFCNTSLGSDPAKHMLLREIIGYSLCNTVKGKSFFLLIGESDSGKSVIINFLGEMLPPNQITNFTLNQCADNRNTQQMCYGRLNISAESDEKSIRSVHILKACTSGDRISAGRRYRDNEMIRPRVHFVFAVNRMPDNLSADTTEAFYRRMRPLIFPYSIPLDEQDPYLLDKLLNERNLIVTAGIWALHRVMHDTSSNYPFTVPESSCAFMREYRENANSVLAFIQDCLVFGADQSGYSSDFNSAYRDYCKRNGLEVLSMKQLITQIKMRSREVQPLRKMENGDHRRGLRGVGLLK